MHLSPRIEMKRFIIVPGVDGAACRESSSSIDAMPFSRLQNESQIRRENSFHLSGSTDNSHRFVEMVPSILIDYYITW